MGTEMVRPSSKSTVKVSAVTTTVRALSFLNTYGIGISLLGQADSYLRGVGDTMAPAKSSWATKVAATAVRIAAKSAFADWDLAPSEAEGSALLSVARDF